MITCPALTGVDASDIFWYYSERTRATIETDISLDAPRNVEELDVYTYATNGSGTQEKRQNAGQPKNNSDGLSGLGKSN